jgi:tetrahydromethanopterin S-methyltransferase subunit F
MAHREPEPQSSRARGATIGFVIAIVIVLAVVLAFFLL